MFPNSVPTCCWIDAGINWVCVASHGTECSWVNVMHPLPAKYQTPSSLGAADSWSCRVNTFSSCPLSEEKSRRNQGWRAIFISTYCDLGRYIHYYATLKKAWDDLEQYLGQWCPRMIGSLKGTPVSRLAHPALPVIKPPAAFLKGVGPN